MKALLEAPQTKHDLELTWEESWHTEAPGAPSHDAIARRAYEIWQRHGCPAQTDFQDWLAAEAELRSPR